MSNIKRCDQCQREAKDFERGWRRIEYASMIAAFEDDQRPLDFCSWKCIADYAAIRRGPVRLPPLQVDAS